MTTNIGHVTATFDKNGERGYRIKNQYFDDWVLLDEQDKPNYNPGLKNREVEYDFVILKDKKGKEKNILTFIQIEGEVKVEKIGEGKPSFSNEHLQPEERYKGLRIAPLIIEAELREDQDHSNKESREMARDFAHIRAQAMQLALHLYPNIKSFSELVESSIELEEYIKTGRLR